MNYGISDLPHWSQAGAVTLLAILMSLVFLFIIPVMLLLELLIDSPLAHVPVLRWLFTPAPKPIGIRIAWVISICIFWPTVVGTVSGGVSLVYGIFNEAPDFIVGAVPILSLSVLVWIVYLARKRLYWLPIVGGIIGLWLVFYGLQDNAASGFSIVGGILFWVALWGFAVITRPLH